MTLRNLSLVLALLAGLGAISCHKGETPEQRIRAVIVDAEDAAEKREIARVRGHVSERYLDEDKRDRRTVEGMLRLYLLRNEAIHLFTRIESIIVTQPSRAEAVVYVGMAARPIKSADELRNFNANLYRFEIGFEEENKEWRVVRANWRPAELIDFTQ